MQFSYVSALLATLALSNAVALPQPDAAALVPADIVNDLEVRDPQIGFGGGSLSLGLGISINIDAELSFIQSSCGNPCGTCQSYISCFENVCGQQGYSFQKITALRSRLAISANIGLSAGFDIEYYRKRIGSACPSFGYQCFVNYCHSQGYSEELISTLQINLQIAVTASASGGFIGSE